jgi:AhpD family alkylhydroperoxidase
MDSNPFVEDESDGARIMKARMKNPATVLEGALQGIQALNAAKEDAGVPATTLGLVHLRASQINGCRVCVESGSRHLKRVGESDERIFALAAWRKSPHFTDSERAALALAEATTRLSDRANPVPDEVWNEAARHYDEKAWLRWFSRSASPTSTTV